MITALTLNRLAQRGPPLAGRLVPLAAVAAANCVNIPLMRITELQNGIELQAEDGTKVGQSKRAAKQAITTVTLSRILMASPSMSEFFCFYTTHINNYYYYCIIIKFRIFKKTLNFFSTN